MGSEQHDSVIGAGEHLVDANYYVRLDGICFCYVFSDYCSNNTMQCSIQVATSRLLPQVMTSKILRTRHHEAGAAALRLSSFVTS